jgi:hypothetical protein
MFGIVFRFPSYTFIISQTRILNTRTLKIQKLLSNDICIQFTSGLPKGDLLARVI